ncbi:MAG: 50S ribosomal protein L14 [Candidatus Thermoplasmatota archaeon]|jgi:large subunit ribosomal protein L14|nr:50S ribosomal protein L14 [Candidatus Thermoplasmatota archaeon]MCL5790235.1 50S ribosomal protein L14 [Candidatus Thermoplasmatota archaeon]
MKGLAGTQIRGLPLGANLECADNSGAKIISLINVKAYHNTKSRVPAASVGDMIIASVKKGSPEMRRKVVYAVVIRQRKTFRRQDGLMVEFEDNAAVLVQDNGETRGTEIKGPVAKEAAERWPRVAALASSIV